MFCSNCGASLPEGARFCANCGATVEAPARAAPSGRVYPVRLSIARPETQVRWLNLPLFLGTFIRVVLVLPHLLALAFLGLASSVAFFIATFAILFTGRYPRGLFDFNVGVTRWNLNVSAYVFHLYDTYPPFSLKQQDFPLVLEVDYPERLSRWLNNPFLIWLIKPLLLLPHFIVIYFFAIVAYVLLFIAQFAILFSKVFPAGMHAFVVGVLRWQTRVGGYAAALTDRDPPFSTT
jgi:hypothetical protein